jgi:hypothetical protein
MRAVLLLCVIGCKPTVERKREPVADGLPILLVDRSASSGFDEQSFGHFKRGRTCAPGDFDGDGRLDLFVGSPTDPGLVVRNITVDGVLAFEAGQVLHAYGPTTWAAASADFDNDGDVDLFTGRGGNEDEQLDVLWRNDGGTLVDIADAPPLNGPADQLGVPLATATAGARWGDFDLDGDLDLFVSTNVLEPGEFDALPEADPQGRDRLLRNDGVDGWTDVAFEAGLVNRDPSFNSSLIDFDNDGDLDIYQQAIVGWNHMWRNQWQETGELTFTDATGDLLASDGLALAQPRIKGFSTASGDLNNDGWTDLLVWHRGPTEPNHTMPRHLVFLNLEGEVFVEVGKHTGLSARWHACEDLALGVMGSQLADLDLDGGLDVFIGNGAPQGGCANQLWLFDGLMAMDLGPHPAVQIPTYADASVLLDVPVEGAEDVPYPYRTHGTCVADYDGDGLPELAFVNGGPGWSGDEVREPNRIFDIVYPVQPHWLRLRPVGDGVAVNRDGVGSRVAVGAVREDGTAFEVHRTLWGGNGFVAQNGPDVMIGLGDSVQINSVIWTWPDGTSQDLGAPDVDQMLLVHYGP